MAADDGGEEVSRHRAMGLLVWGPDKSARLTSSRIFSQKVFYQDSYLRIDCSDDDDFVDYVRRSFVVFQVILEEKGKEIGERLYRSGIADVGVAQLDAPGDVGVFVAFD